MTLTPEKCQNCDRTIGKLESAFVWHDNVICEACYQNLAGRKAVPANTRMRLAVFAVVLVAAIVTTGYRIYRWESGHESFSNVFSNQSTVSGSIWISMNDASSQLLRGAPVYLLTTSASTSAVSQAFTQTEEELNWAASQPQFSFPNLSRSRDAFGKYKNMTNVRDVSELFEELTESSLLGVPHFSAISGSVCIRRTHANVDGKYSFDQVISGDYFLYSIFSTNSAVIEWLVPVKAQTGEITEDLNNANARLIVNTPEEMTADVYSLDEFAKARWLASRDLRDQLKTNDAAQEAVKLEILTKTIKE